MCSPHFLRKCCTVVSESVLTASFIPWHFIRVAVDRMRLMRSHDRIANSDRYPSLRYPEIYLLEGGYQAFHSMYGSSCSPSHGYTPMCHRDHSADLKTFKTQLKSTEADVKKSRATWKATGRLFRWFMNIFTDLRLSSHLLVMIIIE
jgi:hypothetical protein